MNLRQSLDFFAFGCMVFFCLIMASQQVILKAVAHDISPVFQIALRYAIALVLLMSLIHIKQAKFSLKPENRIPAAWIGLLFTLEFLCLGEALKYTSASHTIVFLYTSPIFAAIGLHVNIPTERMNGLQWSGILFAFGGITLAFLGKGDAIAGMNMILGNALALLAGAAWGATTVIVRATGLSTLPARQVLFYQLLMSSVILLVWSFWTGQIHINPTPEVIASLAFHGIGVAFLGFLLWFWLLTRYQASQLSILSFMTPVFGVLLGSWWLDEEIQTNFIFGAIMILIGILMVTGHGWITQKKNQLLR